MADSNAEVVLALGVLARAMDTAPMARVRDTFLRTGGRSLAYRFLVGHSEGGSSSSSDGGGGANLSSSPLHANSYSKHDDVVLLPARDGGAAHLKEKVLAWLSYAVSQWPNATWIGKCDLDSLPIFPRLFPQLSSALAQGRSSASPSSLVYAGTFMAASFDRAARRFCGCCANARNWRHALTLQSSSSAAGGACPRQQPMADGEAHNHHQQQHAWRPGPSTSVTSSSVAGPFRFAGGSFYALTTPLARLATASAVASDAVVELAADRWPFQPHMNGAEDLFVGYLVHAAEREIETRRWHGSAQPNATGSSGAVARIDFGHAAIHNLDYHTLHHYTPACQRMISLRRSPRRNATSLSQGGEGVRVGDDDPLPPPFTTGALSGRDDDEEVVGPASMIIHHVRGDAQWRRASELAAAWSRWLHHAADRWASRRPPNEATKARSSAPQLECARTRLSTFH